MSIKFTVLTNPDTKEHIIQRDNEDGSVSFIPEDEANSDYQAYLESLKPTK